MAKLTAVEQFILKRLIKAGRLNVKEAEGLVQVLSIERMESPETELTDLIVKRKLASSNEVNKLLWDAEEAISDHGPTARATQRAASSGSGARRTREAAPRASVAERRRPAPSGNSRMILIVGVLFWAVVGVGAFLYIRQQQNSEEIPTGGAGTEVASNAAKETPASEEPRAAEMALADSEPVETTAVSQETEDAEDDGVQFISVAEAEAGLVKALRHASPKMRLEVLSGLLETCPDDPIKQEIEREHQNQLDRANVRAEVQFDRRRKELAQFENSMQLRDAQGIYAEFLAEYGPQVLHGTFQAGYDRLKKLRRDTWKKDWEIGVDAFEGQNYELARRTFSKVMSYASSDQIVRAKDYLQRLDKVIGSSNLLTDEELAEVQRKEQERAEKARKKREEKNEEESDVTEVPPANPDAQLWGTELGKRVRKISDRLDDLFSCASVTLSPTGEIEFTYEFSEKRYEDADDWSPALLEVVDARKPVRWTLGHEEEYTTSGLKIGDKGVFIHDAPLRAPFTMKMTFRNMTSFQPRNLVSACWVSRKGKGVGGNFGRQCCTIARFTAAKRNPTKLASVGAERDYTWQLEVTDAGQYSTSGAGHSAGPGKIPKKMELGHAAIIWSGTVSGVVTHMTFKGMLDLDWAEKKLGL